MARKTQPLKIELYVGNTRIEKLTEAQTDKMAERLSEQMSEYYTQHISEYANLKTKGR